ncbi:ATP-binding protein [Virgisporangium ochraceum]|uniref:SARP family transcriptional regulator n=1 Tax=Virgisporangium ochraceum TaxID=65505 RepID=A0A8J3ZZJ4_9ACTN|nr:helix-turn-helix domain-containing protein [Virgisporangium ochraceum]GIJ72947.1 SARP family transcriptional regulator [Virgisporangium ochraceum]
MTTGGDEAVLAEAVLTQARAVTTVQDLAAVLRRLRRRQARGARDSPWTLRELAARTGWAHSTIGQYLSGQTLPPTDRFDALIHLFGATPVEQGALASARDRVEETQRRPKKDATGRRPVPALEPPAAGEPVTGAHPSIPRQLPARVAGFAGRAVELTLLDGLLTTEVTVAVISGTAGVGKTALAVHWAHRVADRFPDGQFFVNLRGFEPTGPPLPPDEALRHVLDGLGVPADRIPSDPGARAGLYRTAMAGRRMLIVLDNAASVDQVRPLLPGSAGCLVLVTSRDQLTALTVNSARPLPLGLLSVDEAGDLLAGRLGAGRLTAEPAAAQLLIEACARLPLALSIVAARAAGNPTFPLASLGAELTRSNRLDALDGGDPTTDLRTVLSWSYTRLRPATARLFRLLGLHPGPDISAAAVTSLAGADARASVTELVRANLLIESAPGRYVLHDLLREYSAELAAAVEPAERAAARLRVLDHYLHTAYAAARILSAPRDDMTPDPPAPGVRPEPVADHRAAIAWFTAEREVLLAAVRGARDAGLDRHTWQLAWSMFYFLHLRDGWHDALATQEAALAAVRDVDPAAEAAVRRDLGQTCTRLGRFDEAYTHLERALAINTRRGDREGVAWIHYRIAWTVDHLGRHADALRHSEHALALFTELGNLPAQAHARNVVGWYLSQVGQHGQAVAECQRALDLYRSLDDDIGQANTLDSLGCVYFAMGEYERAASYHTRSLEFFRALGEPYYTAQALTHVGDVRDALGDADAARTAWREALAVFDSLGHTNADAIRARLG